MDQDISHMRIDYDGAGLRADAAGDDPMALFARWFEMAAGRDSVAEPNAMALATTNHDMPSVRMVLLKHVDPAQAAFTWYTHLDSRKAREITSGEHRAALVWWWPGTPGMQVRATGRVEPVESDVAAAYYSSRPRGARIGAAVSRQSRALGSRSDLETRAADLDVASGVDGPNELPPAWGGLRLCADELEFWHGRHDRLHDRITFLRVAADGSLPATSAVAAAGGAAAVEATATRVIDPHGSTWLRLRLEP